MSAIAVYLLSLYRSIIRWFYMQFEDTPWSLILRAKDANPDALRDALEQLCRSYWSPLYTFVRVRGRSPEDAQDIVQGFFEQQIGKDFLHSLDPGRGHFRSYLLSAMTNFMVNEHAKSTRQKRGSGQHLIPIDTIAGERAVSSLTTAPITPERAFEKEWALSLIERTMERLRAYYQTAGSIEQYEALQPFISVDALRPSYAQLGEQLSLTESAVKSALFRLRGRYRDALRDEVRRVINDPADEHSADEEIRYLMGLFSS